MDFIGHLSVTPVTSLPDLYDTKDPSDPVTDTMIYLYLKNPTFLLMTVCFPQTPNDLPL